MVPRTRPWAIPDKRHGLCEKKRSIHWGLASGISRAEYQGVKTLFSRTTSASSHGTRRISLYYG